MTVCIGALCADQDAQPGRAVVIASDRMVTMGGMIEFEHEVPKIKPITDHILGLVAGDALRGARLASDVRAAMLAAGQGVEQVAEAAAQRYAQLRLMQLDSEVFAPRSISIQQFYEGGLQTRMVPQIAGMIDQQVMAYNWGVELLIAGVDDSGAHLFSVFNPGGIASNHQSIGFTAIGSGGLQAIQSLIGFGHTLARDLHETVFRIYVSKRRAEAAPGVGTGTDLAIIQKSGVTYVDRSIIDQLADLYHQFQQPVVENVSEKVAKLNVLEGGNGNAPIEP